LFSKHVWDILFRALVKTICCIAQQYGTSYILSFRSSAMYTCSRNRPHCLVLNFHILCPHDCISCVLCTHGAFLLACWLLFSVCPSPVQSGYQFSPDTIIKFNGHSCSLLKPSAFFSVPHIYLNFLHMFISYLDIPIYCARLMRGG